MNDEQWRDEFTAWLEGFPWNWFCALTFRSVLKPAQARWRMRHWVDALRDALGTANFGFIAVPEFGRTGMDLHYHLLVTGLRPARDTARSEWMRRWQKLAGDARITTFTPAQGGVRYILKTIGPDNADVIEFELIDAKKVGEK